MQNARYVIRPATTADLNLVRNISIEIFDYTFRHQNNPQDFDDYVEKAFNETQLQQELNNDNCLFFLVFDGDQDIAYAKLGRGNQEKGMEGYKTMEIERFYVRKEFQGKGVAQGLMEHCLKIATDEAFELVWLGVWEHNQKAIRFYEKQGFTISGSHPFWVGNDCQTDKIMIKHLQ